MKRFGVNKVIILGRLAKDPVFKYTANGNPVAFMTVVTSDSWKDKSGLVQERAEWHRVVIYGKCAEIAGQYLAKGNQVYIEGQLQTSKWQDNNGKDRYKTDIVVQGYKGIIQLLGKADDVTKAKATLKYGQSAKSDKGDNYAGEWPHSNAPDQSAHYNWQTQYNEPPVEYADDIPFAKIGLCYANHYLHII